MAYLALASNVLAEVRALETLLSDCQFDRVQLPNVQCDCLRFFFYQSPPELFQSLHRKIVMRGKILIDEVKSGCFTVSQYYFFDIVSQG